MTKDLASFGIWVVLLGLALTSSVLAAVLGRVLERNGLHLDRVRDGYAEATKALMAWSQFPYRIERRVDDKDETRAEFSALGSDIMERLGYCSGWVTAENPVMASCT